MAVAWLLGFLLVARASVASHIIGGDVSMQAVGNTPGLFKIQLNQYWDELQIGDNRDATIRLLVYSRTGPKLIEAINLPLREVVPLTYNNAACAEFLRLDVAQARYVDTVQFNPQRYDDAAGYYVVWERCCRIDNLDNVNSSVASGVGMVFYLEFPPMVRQGKSFRNSSPAFKLAKGDYICINKPFTYDVSATDADGDRLVYKLVTPLTGYTTRTAPYSTNDTPRSSYPLVKWAQGHGLANIIPGSPPLSINTSTGQVSVRARRAGIFLFTVQCEEFRNGQRIGIVRRDMQLLVVDCTKNTPPPAVVSVNNQPVSGTLTWCDSQPLVLRVEKDSSFRYQWQANGVSMPGLTTDTLRVNTAGTYTVVKSRANACANDTTSEPVKVTFVTTPTVKLSMTPAARYCTGDTVTLQATKNPGYEYRWQRNGADLPEQKTAVLRVTQSGRYAVFAKPTVAVCEGQDSVRVVINERPAAEISAAKSDLCSGDSLLVRATHPAKNRYDWQRNGSRFGDTTSRAMIRLGGTYRTVVTAPSGCTAQSNSLTITQNEQPVVSLDSIAPICGTSTTAVTLNGQPAGGLYAGAGVTGNQFDPASAGVGRHRLTYTVTTEKGCRAVQTRQAVVSAGPTLTGETRYLLYRGNSVQLRTRTSEAVSRYRWTPPESLDHPDVASPVASPGLTTAYVLTVLGVSGCPSSLSIAVEVIDPLHMPSAFSPNADGVNDVWEIRNISQFPDCEVSIYDRWGEAVFNSKGYAQPWDGSYKQERVSPGLYTYRIRTGSGPTAVTYQGQLAVLR